MLSEPAKNLTARRCLCEYESTVWIRAWRASTPSLDKLGAGTLVVRPILSVSRPERKSVNKSAAQSTLALRSLLTGAERSLQRSRPLSPLFPSPHASRPASRAGAHWLLTGLGLPAHS